MSLIHSILLITKHFLDYKKTMPKKFFQKSCISSDDDDNDLTDLMSKINASSIRTSSNRSLASTSSSFAAANRKNTSNFSMGRKVKKSVNVGASTSGCADLTSATLSRPSNMTKLSKRSTTVSRKNSPDKVYTKECSCNLPPFKVEKANKPVCVVKGVQRNGQREHTNSGNNYHVGRPSSQVELNDNLMSLNRHRLGSYVPRMNSVYNERFVKQKLFYLT